jgi:hypothetical protein
MKLALTTLLEGGSSEPGREPVGSSEFVINGMQAN